MKYQIVVSEEMDRRVRRVGKVAMFPSISEFIRAAIRFYVEKLEENYAEELTQ